MKKFGIVIVIVILILAVLTKPTKQDYISWMKDDLKRENNNNIVLNIGVELVGDFVMESTSSCSNYVFFNVCNTNLLEAKEMSAVGLFNQFIRLK